MSSALTVSPLFSSHPLGSRSPRHLQPAGQRQRPCVRPGRDAAPGRHEQPVAAHGQRSAALRHRLGAHPAVWDFIHRRFRWTCQLPSLHRWTTCGSAVDWFVQIRRHNLKFRVLFWVILHASMLKSSLMSELEDYYYIISGPWNYKPTKEV